MKVLLPGVTGAFIVRAPAKRRGPPVLSWGQAIATYPPATPDRLRFVWPRLHGPSRQADYCVGYSEPALFAIQLRLGHAGDRKPQGGWLWNEQVNQTWRNVTDF